MKTFIYCLSNPCFVICSKCRKSEAEIIYLNSPMCDACWTKESELKEAEA